MSLRIYKFNLCFPHQLMQFLLLWLLFSWMQLGYGVQSNISEQLVFDQLTDLSLEELAEVEVTLSDVFDIFDALVYTKEVKLATGTWQSTARAPSVTTVITAQDIEATGATNLEEVLEMVPGLHVAYQSTYTPIYTIRGIYSDFNPEVLVHINGVPVKRLEAGNRGMSWAGMPINAIARIEIIRGPGSAIYGADAFAGIINIITKTKEDIDGTETGIRIGNFDTQEYWALHGGNYGGFDVALTLEYNITDGHQEMIEVDGQTHFDNVFGTHASLAPRSIGIPRRYFDTRLDVSRGNWQLRGGYQGRHRKIGINPGGILDFMGGYADESFNVDLIYHNQTVTDNWDVTAQLSYFRSEYETRRQTIYPPGAFGGAFPEGMRLDTAISESHTDLDISGFYAGFKKHLIRVGIGYYYGDLYDSRNYVNTDPVTGFPIPPSEGLVDLTDTPNVFIPERNRQNWHLFLQDMWSFAPNWELTAGLRYDEYSDFGSTFNPRVALVWQPRPNLTTKLLYGSAFRAPVFLELYVTSNPEFRGNLDLEPETIDTWELAFNYQATEKLHFAMNFFTYKLRDGILYLPGIEEGTYQAQNAGIQKGHGLEFETRWKLGNRSSLLLNYAYQKATDENNHQDAGNYPQHSAYLRTDRLVIPNWYLDAQINWIGERKRAYGDPRSPLDNYTTVDLTLRRKDIQDNHWNFAISIRNLFDTDVREPSPGPESGGSISIPNDLPLAGRHYFLELRYRF